MTLDTSDPNKNGSRLKNKLTSIFIKSKSKSTANNNQLSPAYDELTETKQRLIERIIDLSQKNAGDIMIPRIDVFAIPQNTSWQTIVKITASACHSRIPVYNETIDNIIGILYVKDLLKFMAEKPKKFQLKKILNKPYFVPEAMPINDLLIEFKKNNLDMAIVVDEHGGIDGLLTLKDLMEEIAVNINDDNENERQEMIKTGKNVFMIDSRITISDFNKEAGLSLPTDEFDTIGGFVFDLFGNVPQKNETIKYNNISFKIHNTKGTRINQIIVTIHNNKQKH